MTGNKATMAIAIPTKSLAYFTEPCYLAIIYTNRKTPFVKTALPAASLLNANYDFQYSNSYLTTYRDVSDELQVEDLVVAFTKAIPFWFKLLYSKETKDDGLLKKFFNVRVQTSNEVVLETNNRCVTCRIALLITKARRDSIQKNIMLATTASFDNPSGRLYFRMLKLAFEFALVTTLKRMIKYIQAGEMKK